MASIFTQTEPAQKPAEPCHSLMGVRMVACGSYVPERVVRNEDLASLGCDEQWIVQRTGILERRHCDSSQATSDLAVAAAEACLMKAQVHPRDLDVIIVATMTPDHFTPSTAAIVQARLRSQAIAWDMNAACSGFIFGVINGSQFIKAGTARNVLVIGADAMSRVINPQDVKTYPLFGDAAGAVLLQANPNPDPAHPTGFLAYRLATEGNLGYYISVPGAGSRQPASAEVLAKRLHYLQMDGRPVFKWAVRTIPKAMDEVLTAAGMTLDDVDMLLLHQANRRIIDAALHGGEIPAEKVFINVHKYGNTSAASIPLLLDEAISAGATSLDGHRLLMCGFGGGLTWGGFLYQG